MVEERGAGERDGKRWEVGWGGVGVKEDEAVLIINVPVSSNTLDVGDLKKKKKKIFFPYVFLFLIALPQ